MRKVPFLDVQPLYHELKKELDAAFLRVMESGWYILGSEVEAFEGEFAAYCGVKHFVGVGETKLAAEEAVLAAKGSHSGRALGVVLRMAAIYGPRMQG